RGKQCVADTVHREASRPHHARAREGSQAARRPERPVRRRRHADCRGAAYDPRPQLEHPGDDRIRVPGARRIRSHDRDGEVHSVLPQGAGVMRAACTLVTVSFMLPIATPPQPTVQVGYCTSLKNVAAAKAAGFDYVELGTTEIAALTDADFEAAAAD